MEKKEKVQFTHFDEQGNAWMVDVGAKADTVREAAARGSIHMSRECLEMVTAGKIKKGDVLGIARIAGIMGAKKTSDLIPLCHPLPLTKLTVEFAVDQENRRFQPSVRQKLWERPGLRWRH